MSFNSSSSPMTPHGLSPIFYRQAILRKANAYVDDNDRYVLKFTNDQTLRDNLDVGYQSLTLKNQHVEWKMIRKEQPSAIPRTLWDKLTESMVGYKLNTIPPASIRVPALDRQLYDDLHGTETQYGLGDDQAFVNKDLALATVLTFLKDPNTDFSPVIIDDFFERNDFSTPAGIEVAMDEIYRSFNAVHVNRIWFSALQDAFTTNHQCREIFKTSWIALHGIRILEVGGMFDD